MAIILNLSLRDLLSLSYVLMNRIKLDHNVALQSLGPQHAYSHCLPWLT